MTSAAVHTPSMTPGGRRVGGHRLAAVCLLALALALTACAKESSDQANRTADGYLIEPADAVGPDAFTPAFTSDASICDKQAFLTDLQARPDALREWAKVLGIAKADVPAYVASLQPKVLTVDTKVINHGLRDGQAYPRNSLLPAGTAVLVDTRSSATFVPPAEVTTPSTPTSASSSSTPSVPTSPPPPVTSPTTTTTIRQVSSTLPGGGIPVTRCKCGNPLLPPGTSTGTVPGTIGTVPGTTGTTGTTATTKPPVTRPTTPPGTNTGTSATVPSSETTEPSGTSTPSVTPSVTKPTVTPTPSVSESTVSTIPPIR